MIQGKHYMFMKINNDNKLYISHEIQYKDHDPHIQQAVGHLEIKTGTNAENVRHT